MITYFKEILATINDSIDQLDFDTFEVLVDRSTATIKAGNKIIVSGLGKNVPICEKFVGTMTSLGLPANFMHSNTAIHGDLGIVKTGDIVILLTKSGETAESIILFDLLKQRDIEIWLITFNPLSTLAKTVPDVFTVSMDHEGDTWDIVPNNSTTIYLIILQALAIITAEKMEITLEQFKENHPGGAIGEKLRKA
jgi:arabinose-5-phosphate isomerase